MKEMDLFKRFIKRKVTFTQSLLVTFLITGSVVFAANSVTPNGSNADGNGNVVVGDNVTVNSKNSIIMGDNITTWTRGTNDKSHHLFILGNDINGINTNYGIIVGKSAGQAGSGEYNFTIGEQAGDSRTGEYTFTYGKLAGFKSNGKYNFAFGENAGRKVAGDYNIAFGYDAGQDLTEKKGKKASNNFHVGHGAGNQTSGSNNVAMGYQAGETTSGNYNYVFGSQAGKMISGNDNFAFGPKAGTSVSGNGNFYLGEEAGKETSGSYNIAFGGYSGQRVKGISDSSQSKGWNNIAFGKFAGSDVVGNHNIAFGENAGKFVGTNKETSKVVDAAEHNTAIGFGAGNYVAGQDNFAAGVNAGSNVVGESNFTLGKGAGTNIKGNHNVSFGEESGKGVTGDSNVALGRKAGNEITASDTVSIGSEAKAEKEKTVALGYKSAASSLKAMALGGEAVANIENSIALGDNSKTIVSGTTTKSNDKAYTTGEVNGKTLTFAGGNNVIGVLSVGNEQETRRIQNVAPGLISADSTDAVNGSQLYALANSIVNSTNTTGSKINYFSVKSDDSASPNNTNWNNDGAKADNGIAIGRKARAWGNNADNSVAIGYDASAWGHANGSAIGAVAIGAETRSLMTGGVAMGNKAKVEADEGKGVGGIAIGNGAYSHNMYAGNHEDIIAFNFKNDKDHLGGGIAIGNKTHARMGTIDLGHRDYVGKIGDIDFGTGVMTPNNVTDAVGSTTVGTNSINSGNFSSINGSYNVISNRPTKVSYGGFFDKLAAKLSNIERGTQGFGSTISGTLNSIENNFADGFAYSGMASSIVGIGNRVNKSNATVIIGAGNEVTNSYLNLGSSSPMASKDSIKELADTFRKISNDNRLGSVGIIGGANKVDYAILSSITGVGNELKGTADSKLNNTLTRGEDTTFKGISSFNSINGYENKATNVNYNTITGTKNVVENADKTVLMGNNFTLKGTTEAKADKNILIGFNDENKEDRIKESAKNITSLGNNNEIKADNVSILGSDVSANVENSVYLGNSSTMIKDKGKNLTKDKTEGTTTTAGATETFDKAEIKDGDNVIATYSGFAGAKSVGGITVGAAGSERRIMNVAAGEISATSTDAINGSQIYAIAKNIKNVASEAANTAVTNLDKGNVTSNTLTITNGTGRVLGTDNLNLEIKEGSITSSHLSTDLNNTINNKVDKTYVDSNFVKLDGSNIDDTNKVNLKEKLDIGNGEVKEGDNKTVTGDTVYKALKNFNEGNNVTNNSINTLNDKVDKLDGKFQGAIAATAAIAGIPQVASDKLFGIGAGVSSYGGKQAIAFGISGQNLGRNIVYKISGSVDTNKNFIASAGINYSFGNANPIEKIKELKDLQDTIDSLKKDVAQIKSEKAVVLNKELLFVIDNFRLDGSEISKPNADKIKEVVEELNKNYKDRIIDIIGYTDTHAGDKYNLSLGLRRANAVANLMKEYGLDESFVIRRIESQGYNQVKNGSYGQHRRVEIIVK